jgi:hypothetical protein
MIIVLLPKGGGDYHGIGLLDPIWKVVEKVMVFRFSVIQLHDCLHGRLSKAGDGDSHNGGQSGTTVWVGRPGPPEPNLVDGLYSWVTHFTR